MGVWPPSLRGGVQLGTAPLERAKNVRSAGCSSVWLNCYRANYDSPSW